MKEIPMRIRVPALLCSIVLLSLVLASFGPPARAQTGTKRQVSYQGVSFTYDTSLAAQLFPRTLPVRVAEPNESLWSAHPELILFDFTGSGLGLDLNPLILIFPVRESYSSLDPDDPADPWGIKGSTLPTLIAQKPDLHSPNIQRTLPYLPPINAAVIPIAKMSYLNFRNGSGIRYIAHITQEPSLPSKGLTVYTFQGLTADGKYYVAAKFPAFPSTPPPTPTPDISRDFGEDHQSRLQFVREQFDRIDNSAYNPDLNKLDEMIQSLRVEPTTLTAFSPDTFPGMPRTGTRGNGPVNPALLALGIVVCATGLLLLRRNAAPTN
jgi:hypothetical protein